MKTISGICMAICLALAFGACTSETNSSSGSGNGGCGGEAPAAKTPAEQRAELVSKMKPAYESLDFEKVKPLFHADEHSYIEEKMAKELKELKDGGATLTMKVGEIEEKDGKFFVSTEMTIKMEGAEETEKRKIGFMEKDGKWWLTIKN